MRRLGPDSWSYAWWYAWSHAWRRLITLVCISAFVFAAVAHAGHHVAPLGEKAAFSTPAVPSDCADDNEPATADTICLFCALAAAEIISTDALPRARISERVETRVFALTTRPVPAEFPPPIA